MKIYVSGILRGPNKLATEKNHQKFSLVCRKILLTENVPVAPILMADEWRRDPRLSGNDDWWVVNVFSEYMNISDVFCLVQPPSGIKAYRLGRELELWRTLKGTEPIYSDFIVKYLLGA